MSFYPREDLAVKKKRRSYHSSRKGSYLNYVDRDGRTHRVGYSKGSMILLLRFAWTTL